MNESDDRAASLEQAVASVHAEGLLISDVVLAIVTQWAHGEIDTAEMRDLVRALCGAGDGNKPRLAISCGRSARRHGVDIGPAS